MHYEQQLDAFATILLICVVLVVIIDVGAEAGLDFCTKLKWTLLWYIARYTAIICALLLAANVLTD